MIPAARPAASGQDPAATALRIANEVSKVANIQGAFVTRGQVG